MENCIKDEDDSTYVRCCIQRSIVTVFPVHSQFVMARSLGDSSFAAYFFAVLTIFAVVTLYLGIQSSHGSVKDLETSGASLRDSFQSSDMDETPREDQQAPPKTNSLAGLTCEVHGGPSDEAAKEMVYW